MQRSRRAGTLVPVSSFAMNTPHHASLPLRHLPHRLSLSGPKLAPKRNAANETPPRYGMREKIFRALPNGLLQSWPVAGPVLIPVHRYTIGVPLKYNQYATGLASVAASKHKKHAARSPAAIHPSP